MAKTVRRRNVGASNLTKGLPVRLRKITFKRSKHLPEFYKEDVIRFHNKINNDNKHIFVYEK
jgi:hypothetical protein